MISRLLSNGDRIPIERVVPTYSSDPYFVSEYIKSFDNIKFSTGIKQLEYIITLVPLDVIDDINLSDRYNPRRLKPEHRDLLMDQIGTYGLIYPLVATVEQKEKTCHLYLVDGRHRYNGLLQLDEKLKSDIYELAKSKEKNSKSFTAYHSIPNPRNSSINAIEKYKPDTENHDGKPPYLVPVKIYLNTNEIETIGMAVFLNRGQKRLSGGELIEKIAKAFEISLDKKQNEILAANEIDPTDSGKIVACWVVDQIMNDKDTSWFELIGRWQGERLEKPGENDSRLKPLTANNFLIFARTLIDETPKNKYNREQRDLEAQNLVRLGNIFSKVFNWPDDIPVSSARENDLTRRFTPTSILCRSFVFHALGTVLNKLNRQKNDDKILSKNLDEKVWDTLADQISKIHNEFEDQAKMRVRFEELKKQLNYSNQDEKKRKELIFYLDKLRGDLWTLDTVTSTLISRIETTIAHNEDTSREG